MRIVADTATLLSPQDGEAMGITVVPVTVSINDKTYRDYEDISSEEFVSLIGQGGVPTSSQPSVGDVMEVLGKDRDDVVFITVGDGLSGAYSTAVSAKNCMDDNDRISIVNSKTLGGPLRYIVKKAAMLKEQGLCGRDIVSALVSSIESSVSFVIPEDFEFLKRSGRLTAITAKVGGALKLLPVLTQTEDKTRIKPVTVKRSWKTAVDAVIQRLQAVNVDSGYLISVCHTGTCQKAKAVIEQIKAAFPAVDIEMLTLSPALITHGGPGCIVVQAVKK
ncbi:MAG: DegV family protein [Oscillospiraceae bacterium]|nr:DegV family protein [Oscillospiraceae bacterium]